MKVTSAQILAHIAKNDIKVDALSVSNGVYKAKRSYFRSSVNASEIMSEKIARLPGIVVNDHGDHWHAFVGGAKPGSHQDSYIWVSFTLTDEFKLEN
jgi:hypothetical protein